MGVVNDTPVVDLEYIEDSKAETDMNVVMSEDGRFIEVQGTAEGNPFSREELDQMLALGEKGIRELLEFQKKSVGA